MSGFAWETSGAERNADRTLAAGLFGLAACPGIVMRLPLAVCSKSLKFRVERDWVRRGLGHLRRKAAFVWSGQQKLPVFRDRQFLPKGGSIFSADVCGRRVQQWTGVWMLIFWRGVFDEFLASIVNGGGVSGDVESAACGC
jgi:hypothetical protein